MQDKMIRFLNSIGIKDTSKYDMKFVSIYKDKGSLSRNKFRYFILKDTLWEFNQLNEQINKLTRAVEETNNKFQALQEEIEVYKFKQNVKNGFQFNLGYIPINPDSLDSNTIYYQTAAREDGTVYTSVVGIMNPIVKYVGVKRAVRTNSTGGVEYKDTEQVIEFTNERVVLCDIYNSPVATQVDNNKYIIKLTPKKEYIDKENKPQTVYLFVNLAAEKVDYLTLIDCQELGFDINIDKNRKWFSV